MNDIYGDPIQEGTSFFFGFFGSGAAECTLEYFQYTQVD
jgi:hypothetical protein